MLRININYRWFKDLKQNIIPYIVFAQHSKINKKYRNLILLIAQTSYIDLLYASITLNIIILHMP